MLPTPEYDVLNLPNKDRIGQYLHSFSDASFGPYRFNKRRGISGGVILCEGGSHEDIRETTAGAEPVVVRS